MVIQYKTQQIQEEDKKPFSISNQTFLPGCNVNGAFLESFSKFIGVEELMYFCEADIKQLGVRNSAHRARIVSSLVALRDKHERGGMFVQPFQLLFLFFFI